MLITSAERDSLFREFDLFIMGASKSSHSSEFEEDRRIGREKEDESTVQNLHKASSDVTAALFGLELITQSDTPQDEVESKASKLLSEALEELKNALGSYQQ